jgi:MOSC domain-containing protein YiiM
LPEPTVHSVSSSPHHGFSKQPRASITLIAGEGVQDDAHRGRTVQHVYRVRQDPTQPNLAQVHLLPSELLLELTARGFKVGPGELGENVLTEGLDLLSVPLGTRLYLGRDAVLEVTGLRTPCAQIDGLQPGLQQHLWGAPDASGRKTRRAGIMSAVLTGGLVAPGYPVRVELPPKPYRPLPPV